MSKYRFSKWVNSTGGPLVALEKEFAHKWTGIQGEPSDYELACQSDAYVDMLHLHGSEVLIFGDEPLQTLVAYCETSILIVRWMWAENENDVFSEIEKIDLSAINYVESVNVKWKSRDIALFDASTDDYKEDFIRFNALSNFNKVASFLWEPDETISLLVHNIIPLNE